MENIIALDVSKGKSYLVHYQNGECIHEGEINHNQTDFKSLVSLIESLTLDFGAAPIIVFEATGSYSKSLERFLTDHSIDYCLLNPLEAKKECDGLRRHKTDATDAHKLAQASTRFERATKRNSEDIYNQLKSLSRFHEELVDELVVTKTKLHSCLQLTFPELELLFKTRDSELFLNTVECYPHPDLVLESSKTVIKNKLLSNTNKIMSNAQVLTIAGKIIEHAKESVPAVKKDDPNISKVVYYIKRIREIKKEQFIVLQSMKKLGESLPEYEILLSFPGIGDLTALRIIGEVGDIRRFSNNKKLNAYVGIDIVHYQSGQVTYKDHINKRGNKVLRKVMYLAVCSMITQRKRTDNHIVDYYDKLKTQPNGKPHKVAVVACINKLLKVIMHLINTNQNYSYSLTTK